MQHTIYVGDWNERAVMVGTVGRKPVGLEHLFAGFRRSPPPSATLVWSEHAGGPVHRVGVQVDGDLADGDTLARVAAEARMDELSPYEQHALALRHGLVSATTNLILVHQRDDIDRPETMPVLRTVAHSMAAGWGGLGHGNAAMFRGPAVWRREDASSAMSVAEAPRTYDIPAFLRKQPDPYLYRDVLREFINALEPGALRGDRRALLPDSLDEMAAALPAQVIDDLRLLAEAGFPEAAVIRAFVVALAEQFHTTGVTSRLLTALRRLGGMASVATKSELERRVEAVVLQAFNAREHAPAADIPAWLRRAAD